MLRVSNGRPVVQRRATLALTGKPLNLSVSFFSLRVEKEEQKVSEGTNVSPQRLRDSVERCRRKASFYFTAESQTRSTQALRLCRDDGNPNRSQIRESQKQL